MCFGKIFWSEREGGGGAAVRRRGSPRKRYCGRKRFLILVKGPRGRWEEGEKTPKKKGVAWKKRGSMKKVGG